MSTIIKSREFDRLSARAIPFSLKDVEKEASVILSQARDQAEELLAQARADARRLEVEAHEKARAKGHEQGMAEGYEEGLNRGKDQALADYAAKAGQLTDAFHAVLDQFDNAKKEFQAKAENDLLDLSMEIARRVVKRIGAFDRDVVVENLREVIHRVGTKSDLQVRLHPSDMAAVELFVKALTVAEQDWNHVDLVVDDAVSPGGCKLTMREGHMDATLEAQLDHIAALMVPEDRD